ncbi:MAG: MaoC family dehydratase N-terminal domain-containing protein [Haloarculaceae archaeon]
MERTFEDFEVGQRFETGGRTATEADIRMFVGATGPTDPIHVDHDYAADHRSSRTWSVTGRSRPPRR